MNVNGDIDSNTGEEVDDSEKYCLTLLLLMKESMTKRFHNNEGCNEEDDSIILEERDDVEIVNAKVLCCDVFFDVVTGVPMRMMLMMIKMMIVM